jgi:hypothetical protein
MGNRQVIGPRRTHPNAIERTSRQHRHTELEQLPSHHGLPAVTQEDGLPQF